VRYVGRVRVRAQLAAGVIAAAIGAGALAGGSSAATSVTCPASAADSLGPVQWAFTGLGAPSASRAGVTNSWFRGTGTWSNGAAHGTICADDQGGGAPKNRVVLETSSAPSALTPHITKLGLLGVGLTIPVTVTATSDASCAKGTAGTVTLFASYYGVHKDSLVAHFAAACRDHDLTFTGSDLHVEISRNGAQVNAA
jgi:hypothetical protein